MGILRLWLAISVMALHASRDLGLRFTPAGIAVRLFFVMSGFYMAMVYEEKYSGNYRQFILSRILRLWPAYLMALAASIAVAFSVAYGRRQCVGPLLPLLCNGERPSLGSWIYFVASGLCLVGQEWGMFLVRQAGGGLNFQPWNSDETRSAFQMQWIPQAWSLGLEFWFYLLLPLFLKHSNRSLAVFLASSLLARMSLEFSASWSWIPGLPIFDLALFPAGILAWRLRQRCMAPAWVAATFLALTFFAAYLPLSQAQALSLLVILSIFTMPRIFEWCRGSRWDRNLGEISYPFYLLHFSVLWLLPFLLGPEISGGDIWRVGFPLALAASVLGWLALRGPTGWLRKRYLESPLR
jgi:peptidoglycan/LPS O-acetylase OafA/YrhL